MPPEDKRSYYIVPDATTSQGREVFVVAGEEIKDGRLTPETPRKRILPPVTVGYGSTALFDKIVALIHVAFLLDGPYLAGVRSWFARIRVVVSDEGVEALLREARDIVAE